MLATLPYDRDHATAYARRWAFDRNPLFANFSGIGGDCTNFVSQCVLAGCCIMNFTPDFGWYYISREDRAPAWTGVRYFYDFMIGTPEFARENGGAGPYGVELARSRMRPDGAPSALLPGDVVQLADAAGDFYHILLVTGIDESEVYVAAHSDDALDRRLSSYGYSSLRFIHLLGARVETNGTDCFEALIDGIEP